MARHKSTAYVCPGYAATPQFRYIVRLAHACHAKGVAYDIEWRRLEWRHDEAKMAATITATGAIPAAKPLPKPPKEKLVGAWKPAIWDAEYRLDAYASGDKKQPGFVIAHESGLSLVKASATGEWGGDDSDIRDGWSLTHAASGRGFGVDLTFKRAVDALLLAASFPVDWTRELAELAQDDGARKANDAVLAKFAKGYTKHAAKTRLERAA